MSLSFKLISESDIPRLANSISGKSGNLWELSNKQSDFIFMATHQLRAPLVSIKWTLHMLLSGDAGPVNEEQKKWLETSFQSNEKVLGLIDEMLNAIKIDTNTLKIIPEETDITELFKHAVDQMSLVAEKAQLKVKLSFKGTENIQKIFIDSDKIHTVLESLLENAIRYSRPGGLIQVAVTAEEGDIKVSVEDNGIGIPDRDKQNIFSRFFRGKNAFQVKEAGSGLGLFIAKGIIEGHGGKIWFESKEGIGTKFYVIIPLHDAPFAVETTSSTNNN